jgi:Xaa-Pro dipeptidase
MKAAKTVNTDDATLYAQHAVQMQVRFERIMTKCELDVILIASGTTKFAFLDDKPYPFQPNPHFLSWVPVPVPNCWLLLRPGLTPVLAYWRPADYWHLPPSRPQGEWMAHVDVRLIGSREEAVDALLPLAGGTHALKRGRVAILGEDDAAVGTFVPNNPGYKDGIRASVPAKGLPDRRRSASGRARSL